MIKKYATTTVCSLLLLATSSGCALLTKSAPIVPRYFTPESADATAPQGSSPEALAGQRLRFGRIEAGPHLRERMAYRSSSQEFGYYDDRRWTERPDAYLRRALARSLFEKRGVVRAVSGAAPNLDAELTAFEEIKGPPHEARVQVVIRLDDTTGGYLEETFTVTRPVTGDDDDPESVVTALSAALDAVVVEISDRVLEKLKEIPPTEPVAPAGNATTTTLSTTTSPAP